MGGEPRRWSLGGLEGPGRRVDLVRESSQVPKVWGGNWCEQLVFQKQPEEGAMGLGSEVPAIHVTPSSNLKPVCLKHLQVTQSNKQV